MITTLKFSRQQCKAGKATSSQRTRLSRHILYLLKSNLYNAWEAYSTLLRSPAPTLEATQSFNLAAIVIAMLL